jgi:hypothetical protein
MTTKLSDLLQPLRTCDGGPLPPIDSDDITIDPVPVATLTGGTLTATVLELQQEINAITASTVFPLSSLPPLP